MQNKSIQNFLYTRKCYPLLYFRSDVFEQPFFNTNSLHSRAEILIGRKHSKYTLEQRESFLKRWKIPNWGSKGAISIKKTNP